MKSLSRFAIVGLFLASSLASVHAAPRREAPGQADNFYRGVTTVGVVVLSVESTTSTEVVQTTETRAIGAGQGSGKGGSRTVLDENLQDRSVTTTITTTTTTTTSQNRDHHGAPVSRGALLDPTLIVETETSVSSSTEVGDWGPAYSQPSDGSNG